MRTGLFLGILIVIGMPGFAYAATPGPGADGSVGSSAVSASSSGPSTLSSHFSPVFGPTVLSADVFAAGTGLRNIGSGSITVPGVGGPALQAYLYWEIMEPSPSPGANVAVFNGVSVTGTLLGSGAALCWSGGATWAYRADVTSLVSGPGPYSVRVVSGTTSGTDPWGSPVVTPLAEGASLVVVASTSASNEIVIVDGYESLTGGSTTVDIPRVAPSTASSTLVTIGGDGQTGAGEHMDWNGALLATDSWDGSDPQTPPTYSSGNLWDTDSFTVSTVVGTNTLDIHATGDCIGPEAFTLSTPADPPKCMMTGDAYMVNATVYPPPAGPTTIWSERTGPVATTSTNQYGPTAMAHVAGPIVNGYVWGSEIETYADPECRSESRASVAHLDGGSGLPPALLPFEARAVEAWSTSNCQGGHQGGVTIGYLRVGSLVFADVSNTPPPNTVIVNGPVTVILNEQTYTGFPGGGRFEVNAIRIIVAGVLDAKIVGAESDIHDCGQNPPPPPPPPPGCPPGTIGTPPACIAPPTPCPPGTIGVPPTCIAPPTLCPPPSVGIYPNCATVNCPPGTTGTFPNCKVIVQPCPPPSIGVEPNCFVVNCPPPTSGTFPDCRVEPIELCKPPSIGVPPNCFDINVACPPGTSGQFPNCRVEPVDECPIDSVDLCLSILEALPE